MNESKIVVRYAKAIFLLALEKNMLEIVRNDIELVNKTIRDFDQFGAYLKSPVIKSSQKFNLVSQIFKGTIHEISLNFIRLLIQHKRETFLEDIVRRFIDVYRNYKGIKSADVVTAVPLEEDVKQKLQVLLSVIYKTNIELHAHEDSSIIGGFVLKIADKQYDASIASSLKRMKTALISETA